MTSELKVDKITPASGTSTQIGDSGDTFTIPSGVTFANSGTATGFGITGWSNNGSNNDLLPANASAGIYLGVNSATDSNLLHDYEEGAWTPACPNVTVASSEGKYTKIGRLVTVQGFVTLPSTSNNNDVEISGLPFTINNSESGRGGAYITYTTGGSTAITDDGGIFFLGSKNNTLFFASGASGNTTHDNNEYSGKQFYINGQFYTDS